MKTDHGRSVLTVSGYIDGYSAALVEAQLKRLMDINPKWVLDMERVGFIDSAGLKCLLACDQRARKRGGGVSLARLQPAVRRCFEMTRLIEKFDITELPAS